MRSPRRRSPPGAQCCSWAAWRPGLAPPGCTLQYHTSIPPPRCRCSCRKHARHHCHCGPPRIKSTSLISSNCTTRSSAVAAAACGTKAMSCVNRSAVPNDVPASVPPHPLQPSLCDAPSAEPPRWPAAAGCGWCWLFEGGPRQPSHGRPLRELCSRMAQPQSGRSHVDGATGGWELVHVGVQLDWLQLISPTQCSWPTLASAPALGSPLPRLLPMALLWPSHDATSPLLLGINLLPLFVLLTRVALVRRLLQGLMHMLGSGHPGHRQWATLLTAAVAVAAAELDRGVSCLCLSQRQGSTSSTTLADGGDGVGHCLAPL